jgi:hypothetical protein
MAPEGKREGPSGHSFKKTAALVLYLYGKAYLER